MPAIWADSHQHHFSILIWFSGLSSINSPAHFAMPPLAQGYLSRRLPPPCNALKSCTMAKASAYRMGGTNSALIKLSVLKAAAVRCLQHWTLRYVLCHGWLKR